MRKIVTRGLYTYMEGMCPGTKLAGNVEMNEPLKQDKNKSLEGLCVDGRGNEKGIAQNSRTAAHGSRPRHCWPVRKRTGLFQTIHCSAFDPVNGTGRNTQVTRYSGSMQTGTPAKY
jgi:hypothetical protein